MPFVELLSAGGFRKGWNTSGFSGQFVAYRMIKMVHIYHTAIRGYSAL